MIAKKSLGQNFLRDEKVLEHIIQTADLKADDFVIEIGPGTGILTEKLIENSKKVIAIEKDDALFEKLKKEYGDNKKMELIHNDILKLNLPEVISSYDLTDGSYKLVANIPYYITSPIIRLFLETVYPPDAMTLMVQREVAERICAKPGQDSLLSISVKYYADPEIIFFVDRKSFWPVPEVDSAVIHIACRKKRVAKKESASFFRVVKAGFSAKRKTLVNNLAAGLHLDKTVVEQKILSAGFLPSVRAQELVVPDWKKLAELFKEI